ncbi:hypothetical protein [Arthrobacter sp. ZGTC212]|uniref:hypothetical protein n=1 Tax=Arthrobacter sp. ZGTC212 TaxID=2058899 RepID=UPI000CE395CB|nr:hypothetical protein [Arthrobacter sp. ZGTC212]
MKNNTLLLASLISAVLALSACGDSGSTGADITSAPVEPATASTTPAVAEPLRSPRGNIIKSVGEPGGNRLSEGSDEWAFNFTVTDIVVDPACSGYYAAPSENGHLVSISIEATTIQEPDFTEAMLNSVTFDPYSWKVIAPNGTTVNTITSGASTQCLTDSERMPTMIGAAEKVSGKIVLDVPTPTGTLVYAHAGGVTGWEWEYGTK